MRLVEKSNHFVKGPSFPFLVAALVAGLLVFALCFPNPQGPADNGDFSRISSLFCSAPRGAPGSPGLGDLAYSRRFFNFYHQYWTLGREIRGAVRPSSSLLLYLPGWLVASAVSARYYDLNCNAFLLVMVLSSAVFVVIRQLSTSLTRLSAFAVVLLAADAGCSSYLNSFYQESGVLFFFFLLVLLLCLWSQRPTVGCSLAIAACAALLALTKRGVAPSVIVLLLPVLVLLAVKQFGGRQMRLGLLATLVLATGTLLVPTDFNGTWYEKFNCYNFIFSGALPQLEPTERTAFLGKLGIGGGKAAYCGTTAFEPRSNFQDLDLSGLLGSELHWGGASLLVCSYPSAAFSLVARAANSTGSYEIANVGYRSVDFSEKREPLDSIQFWSLFRKRVLHGTSAYAAGFLVALLVGVLSLKAKPGPAVVLSGLVLGSFLASLAQVPIAVFGDGQHELAKHLYFANLTLDTSLVVGAVILLTSFLRRQEDRVHGRASGKQ